MANTKRRREVDHDTPASKKSKTNTGFTIKEFMADFPPLKGPVIRENESPLPRTVLADKELQDTSKERKPPLRSTFNVSLPRQLEDSDDETALNAPFNWMKNQYSHCIIPELGEEYDFDYDSETFHRLRDIHNGRVRIRDGNFLPDYIVCSIASRWVELEEKCRPACDGYLANGEVFVATCLPLTNKNDALKAYFVDQFPFELSAEHYIPRSKYSVHFVGDPLVNQKREIQTVHVGSVLIRNTKTGQLVHIDTGDLKNKEDRAKLAARVLKSWLDFQREKRPEAELGPINDSVPLILDVDKETHPSLRSVQALVSASLFIRRRTTNWGDMKAFTVRGKPSSKAMASYALQNISGWLGLKASKTQAGGGILKGKGRVVSTFENNYEKDGLKGRDRPAPKSQRIRSAKKGKPPIYNDDEAHPDDEASDQEGSVANSSHVSVSGDEDTVVVDQPSDDEDNGEDEDDDKFPDDEVQSTGEDEPEDDEPAKEASPKTKTFRVSIEPEEPEEAEDEDADIAAAHDEDPNTVETQEETVTADEANNEGPKEVCPNKRRIDIENLINETSDNDCQAKGNACGRTLSASS